MRSRRVREWITIQYTEHYYWTVLVHYAVAVVLVLVRVAFA
jgi:hypothetical protein